MILAFNIDKAIEERTAGYVSIDLAALTSKNIPTNSTGRARTGSYNVSIFNY